MWNITNPWTYQPRWRQLNFQNVTGLIERYVVYKKHDNKWRAYCFYIVVILQHNMGTWSWSHWAMHNGVLLFLDKNYYQKVIATYYQLHATLHNRFAACQTRTLLWRTDLLFLLSGPYCRLGGKVQFWNAWHPCHSGGITYVALSSQQRELALTGTSVLLIFIKENTIITNWRSIGNWIHNAKCLGWFIG